MNVEAEIISYLGDALDVPAYGEVPPTRPASFVTVELQGGPRDAWSRSPLVAVQAWAPTKRLASELNDAVVSAMLGITSRRGFYRVEQNSAYPFPDPNSKQHRYQAVFDLVTA